MVSVPGADHLASVLSLHLQFADASFRSVVDARRSIYPLLAGEAAERAESDDHARLRECVSRIHDSIGDEDRYHEESRRLHSLIASASRNRVLALLVEALHQMSEVTGTWEEKQQRAAVRSYEKIVEAIAAG
ncbi:MAG: FCD domain-containing protein [Acidimicrobiales bacterium]|nr:FCD domain-containing protein [Acidimicrobiales bacterium]